MPSLVPLPKHMTQTTQRQTEAIGFSPKLSGGVRVSLCIVAQQCWMEASAEHYLACSSQRTEVYCELLQHG